MIMCIHPHVPLVAITSNQSCLPNWKVKQYIIWTTKFEKWIFKTLSLISALTRMHSSRMHTAQCSGYLSCGHTPPPPHHACPPAMHALPATHTPLPHTHPCNTCPPTMHTTHAYPHHACPLPHTPPPPHMPPPNRMTDACENITLP